MGLLDTPAREGREQDIMTTTTIRRSQAEAAAAEYARLVRAGRYPEADQVARTIDELVGRRTATGVWTVPASIRRMMAGL